MTPFLTNGWCESQIWNKLSGEEVHKKNKVLYKQKGEMIYWTFSFIEFQIIQLLPFEQNQYLAPMNMALHMAHRYGHISRGIQIAQQPITAQL